MVISKSENYTRILKEKALDVQAAVSTAGEAEGSGLWREEQMRDGKRDF